MSSPDFINRLKLLTLLTAVYHGPAREYLRGYRRGLNRREHGELFGTPEEHLLWSTLREHHDLLRTACVHGYRDGLEASPLRHEEFD